MAHGAARAVFGTDPSLRLSLADRRAIVGILSLSKVARAHLTAIQKGESIPKAGAGCDGRPTTDAQCRMPAHGAARDAKGPRWR